MALIGLDLGATKLAAALFAEDGAILHRSQCPLGGCQGADVAALILQQLRNLQAEGVTRGLVLQSVGVSVPGIYHADTGTVWAPNIPGWEQYPLLDELRKKVGEGVAVAIDNDRACSVLGESVLGAARGCKHVIFLAVGTGIGAGILIDGRILRGAHDIAGAIGWMALDRPYTRDYDSRGCFETHASGAGIEKTARRLLAESPAHLGPLSRIHPESLTAHDVFAAFDQGDALAETVVANAVECWGMAVANLVSLFNPEMVVFGGGIFGPAARLLERIEAEARRWGQPISMGKVSLRVSSLGPDACLHGTGQLALSLIANPPLNEIAQ